jgi:hypothetical protein
MSRGKLELLVSWAGHPAANASWVDMEEFKQLYPNFKLEDELILQGGVGGEMSCAT